MYKYFFIGLLFFSACKNTQRNGASQEINNWEFEYEGKWYAAQVPGNIYSDLLNHGLIPDPFYGNNEDSVQWISESEFIYRSNFKLSDTILEKNNQTLFFYGLDTYAKVFLNDSLILKGDNMFRSWKINVNEILNKNNVLIVKFNAANKIEKEKQSNLGYNLPGGERVFTRKAGFHYGWDWGPKITPSGIWRKVNLIAWDDCRINNVNIIQNRLEKGYADLTVNLEIESTAQKKITVKVHDNFSEDFKLEKGSNKIHVNMQIQNPELWWPNGYGKQKLYGIDISILDEKKIIDSQTKKIGLRKIELITDTDSLGESFYFKVNGTPIFMKGANYIPQDNLQNRVLKNNYTNLLTDVKNTNMNMLRVWGGGIYEEDIFYDLCDSLGILIWQDFMFACAMYPSDSLFLDNIKKEAIDNVKRLRHHPSIALWCGNNESSEGWHRWGWQNSYEGKEKEEIWNGYQKIFQEILPQVVKIHSQSVYWESSPKLGRGNPQHQFEGDSHYWGIWHDAEPFENFEKNIPRFMSEYGFQSFPQISTIKSFADSISWNLESDAMKSHQKHPRGNALILEYIKREYPTPKDFKKFIYTSQILQAQGMRIGMEAHRRSQPNCMGTLYWQLNDCWPVASWSSRDYFGNWKALHYMAQDVFKPIMISLTKKENNTFQLWAVSDTESFSDTLIVRIIKLNGELVSVKKQAVQINVGAKHIITLPFCKEDEFIICSLQQKQVQSKIGFTKAIKDYNFPKPNIQYQYVGTQLKITTKTPVFELYLHGVKEKFSDNFFPLLPGEEKIIEINSPEFNPKNLLIWSLYDLKKK